MEKLHAYLRQPKNANRIVLLVLSILAIVFYWSSMTLFPTHVHAWTQSDRLAIAMCFQQNGFDFLHPCNFNLITTQGITAIDFPISEYIVAGISSIFNWDIIIIFRSYILILGLIGLYFVYRFFALFTSDGIKGIVMMLFTFLAPFYTYYLNGFLPSIPAFTFLFIGLYYLLNNWNTNNNKHYLIGIGFLTLAALIRLPFVIPLFAFLCLKVWLSIKEKNNITQLILPFLGIVFVAGYWFYNQYLATIYGSIFLSKFLSIDSLETLSITLSEIKLRWASEYFSPYHYLIIIGIIWIIVWKTVNPFNSSSIQKKLFRFSMIYMIGCLVFFILMGQQFVDHDYYLIDTFFPVLLLLFGLSISYITIKPEYRNMATALFFIFAISMITNTKTVLNERYKTHKIDREKIAYRAFKDARILMDKIQIPESATVLAMDAVTTNSPFILMNRSGVAILTTDSTNIKNGLDLQLDYVAMIDTFLFSDVYFNYPNIIKELDLVDQTPKVRLFKPTKDINSIGFFKQLYHYSQLDFNNLNDSIPTGYSNITPNNELQLELNEHIEYGLTYSQIINSNDSTPIDVVVDADIWMPDTNSTATLVVSYGDYYEPYYIQNNIDTTGVWGHIQFRTQLPFKKQEELKVYFWNADRSYMKYDNFKLLIAK